MRSLVVSGPGCSAKRANGRRTESEDDANAQEERVHPSEALLRESVCLGTDDCTVCVVFFFFCLVWLDFYFGGK